MDLKSIYNENILVDINNLNIFLKEKRGGVDDYLLIELKNKIGNKCNKDGLVKKIQLKLSSETVVNLYLMNEYCIK